LKPGTGRLGAEIGSEPGGFPEAEAESEKPKVSAKSVEVAIAIIINLPLFKGAIIGLSLNLALRV
jgi:hypothetical protein